MDMGNGHSLPMKGKAWRSRHSEDHSAATSADGERNGSGRGAPAGGSPKSNQGQSLRSSRLKFAHGTSEIPIALLSSPSRGIDGARVQGDQEAPNLAQNDTQLRFRAHISSQLDRISKKYGNQLHCKSLHGLFPVPLAPSRQSTSDCNRVGSTAGKMAQEQKSASRCAAPLVANRAACDSLQEVLLLVRRLREGCVSSSRVDAFTMDTYILSVILSIFLGDSIQLSASLARLVEIILSLGVGTDNTCAEMMEAEKEISILTNTLVRPLDLGHAASLHLLWLSVTGGQVERLGGSQKDSARSTGASQTWLQQHSALLSGRDAAYFASNEDVCLASTVHYALVQGRPLVLRQVLLNDRTTLWQRAIILRSFEHQRALAWKTLSKAYIHLPIDANLLGQVCSASPEGDFIEQMLLIDLALDPPRAKEELDVLSSNASASAKGTSNKIDIPDDWDDEGLGSERFSLREQIRGQRIADCLALFELPLSPDVAEEVDASGCIDSLRPWQGRIVMHAGRRVLKLR